MAEPSCGTALLLRGSRARKNGNELGSASSSDEVILQHGLEWTNISEYNSFSSDAYHAKACIISAGRIVLILTATSATLRSEGRVWQQHAAHCLRRAQLSGIIAQRGMQAHLYTSKQICKHNRGDLQS